ncbi:hypothetical protein CHU98_g1152 [Xylaria longipes]|nr:hypothetical protein CHU98_g1152 [Xylaria longipes]
MGASWYNVGIALSASLGTYLYGFDTGIITTREAGGALLQVLIADKLGRTRFMQCACVLVTVGVIVQTVSMSIGMLLAGRVLAGIAVGALSATVPIYLSEISAPKTRGLIGGLSGVGLSAGTMTANWVGFAGSYAPYGASQWRLPLGLQAPWGILLFVCLATYMPKSPRELIQKGLIEEARREFAKIRSDIPPHEAHEEFALMKAQIEYEKNRAILGYREIFKVYCRRVLVCIAVQVLTTVTGVNVIQYYQSIDAKTILALAAIWGTSAFVANVIAVLILPDRWGRRNMLLAGLACVIVTEIYSAVLQREFQHTDNRVGKGFAILGIYIFAVCYFTEAGPTAFVNIGENYYYVFVAICAIYLVLVYFYFPETKQKSLEEIAAAFGDRVMEVNEHDIAVEGEIFDTKATVSHVEER